MIATTSLASLAAFGASLIAVERLRFPPEVHWVDRRPIASLIIGTAAAGWPTNPRGWFLDRNLDITKPAGLEEFEQRLLAWADGSIAVMRRNNAQGMITWDIEGEQFPHKTTYIGDPRLTNGFAPEMANVADRYFQRFRNAGFRVGVTVRPQQFEAGSQSQRDVPDPAALLIQKIRYARRRWGATLVYVDSNAKGYLPMDPAIFRRVALEFPDVLLIPEHSDFRYYGGTAPYGSLQKGFTGTSSLTRLLYPAAFSVIDLAGGEIEQNDTNLEKAVLHGDILLFRGWFPSPETSFVQLQTSRLKD